MAVLKEELIPEEWMRQQVTDARILKCIKNLE
jgi:hypothetical protein